MTAIYQNQPVRILSIDSDPACLVWIVFTDDSDRDAFVPRDELTF